MGSFTTCNFFPLDVRLSTEIWIPDAVTPATGTAEIVGFVTTGVDAVASACCSSGGCCTLDDEDDGKGTGTSGGKKNRR
jgi:hypothetical protein